MGYNRTSDISHFDDILGGSPKNASHSAEKSLPLSAPIELDEQGMAALLRLSLSQVRTKARERVFVRSRRGRYDVALSVGNYVERLREVASRVGQTKADGDPADPLKAEKLRLTRAQADAVEQKNGIAAGELVPVAEVRREWVGVATDIRAQILAIPPRIAARAGLSRESAVALEQELRLALEELSHER